MLGNFLLIPSNLNLISIRCYLLYWVVHMGATIEVFCFCSLCVAGSRRSLDLTLKAWNPHEGRQHPPSHIWSATMYDSSSSSVIVCSSSWASWWSGLVQNSTACCVRFWCFWQGSSGGYIGSSSRAGQFPLKHGFNLFDLWYYSMPCICCCICLGLNPSCYNWFCNSHLMHPSCIWGHSMVLNITEKNFVDC